MLRQDAAAAVEEDYCGCRSRRAAEVTAALSLSSTAERHSGRAPQKERFYVVYRSALLLQHPAVEERVPQFERFYTV